MAPAWQGNFMPYYQTIRDRGLAGARAQTVLGYQLRQQIQQDAINAQLRQNEQIRQWAQDALAEQRFGRQETRAEGALDLQGQQAAALQQYRQQSLGLRGQELGLRGQELRGDQQYRQQSLGLRGQELRGDQQYRQQLLGLRGQEADALQQYRQRQLMQPRIVGTPSTGIYEIAPPQRQQAIVPRPGSSATTAQPSAPRVTTLVPPPLERPRVVGTPGTGLGAVTFKGETPAYTELVEAPSEEQVKPSALQQYGSAGKLGELVDIFIPYTGLPSSAFFDAMGRETEAGYALMSALTFYGLQGLPDGVTLETIAQAAMDLAQTSEFEDTNLPPPTAQTRTWSELVHNALPPLTRAIVSGFQEFRANRQKTAPESVVPVNTSRLPQFRANRQRTARESVVPVDTSNLAPLSQPTPVTETPQRGWAPPPTAGAPVPTTALAEYQAALEWAQANPQDPRATQILAIVGGR